MRPYSPPFGRRPETAQRPRLLHSALTRELTGAPEVERSAANHTTPNPPNIPNRVESVKRHRQANALPHSGGGRVRRHVRGLELLERLGVLLARQGSRARAQRWTKWKGLSELKGGR